MNELDTFISQIQSALVQDSKQEDYPLEDIRQVLDDAGVLETLQPQSYSSGQPPRQLLIREVFFKGHKDVDGQNETAPFTYRRQLNSGLNGWVAGNDKGKTTILKVILWALTGDEPPIKDDVREWLEEVAVEVDMQGDGIFTIHFILRNHDPKVIGEIYANVLAHVIDRNATLEKVTLFLGEEGMRKEISEFFGGRMGYLPLSSVSWKKASVDLKEEVVSWHIYSQALFISADETTDVFFSRRELFGKHHQKTLSMFMGLNFAQAVSQLQSAFQRANHDYILEQRRLDINTTETRGKARRLAYEIQEAEAKVTQLESEKSVFVDPNYFREIGEQVAAQSDRIRELSITRQELFDEEAIVRDELEKLERTYQTLRESIQFKFYFSGLSVERCPQCESHIPKDRIAVEIETKTCRLCGNEFQPPRSVNEQQAMADNTRAKIADLKKKLGQLRRNVYVLEKQIKDADREKQKYAQEFYDISRQERAGISAELRSMEQHLGYLRGQLDQLREQSNEGQQDKLQEMKLCRNILQAASQELQKLVFTLSDNIVARLEEETANLAVRFGVSHLTSVSLGKNSNLMIRQSGNWRSFGKLESGERLRLKLAFHLAMIMLRARDGIGRHPGVLFIDAPGGNELDKLNFGAVLQIFQEIEHEYKDHVQILIASTKDELGDICGQNNVDLRQSGESLF